MQNITVRYVLWGGGGQGQHYVTHNYSLKQCKREVLHQFSNCHYKIWINLLNEIRKCRRQEADIIYFILNMLLLNKQILFIIGSFLLKGCQTWNCISL